MEETIKRIDEEMKRSDELLAQMIPPTVAEKVKAGLNPVDTCEVSAKSFEKRVLRGRKKADGGHNQADQLSFEEE